VVVVMRRQKMGALRGKLGLLYCFAAVCSLAVVTRVPTMSLSATVT